MTYVAPRTTVGFEFSYNKLGFSANPVPYRLKPNTAFKKGMLVGIIPAGTADAGCIFPWIAATSKADTVVAGVMAETIAQADNPAADDTYGLVYDNPFNVYTVTFVPGLNGTAATAGTTTSLVTAVTFGADNDATGSTIYFYEGPGSPAVRVVSSSTHADNTLVWKKPLATAPTTATKIVLLGDAALDAATGGIGVGTIGLTVNADSLRVDGEAQPVPATWPVNCINVDMPNLTMDVMLSGMLANKETIT
jgi:hypothetical protein